MSDEWTPPGYAVFMHRNGTTSRVGNYRTMEASRVAIEQAEINRKDTLGGLFAPDTAKASYSIWKASYSKVE